VTPAQTDPPFVTRPDPATAAPAFRQRFRRHRHRALRASALVLAPLGAVGWLLGAPQGLAVVRLVEVSLAWWAAAAAWLLALAALGLRPRMGRPLGEPR
jgi:hypothetical protein